MDKVELPALAVERVSHWYGTRRALDDVSFTLAPASFAVLLGLNGAGKTTLYSLITHLFATRSGRVRIFGHDVAEHASEALRLLGVVFQTRTLDLDLSVIQNLLYHAALHGIGRNEASQRADALLAGSGLADRARDKVRNLSGGQMRRVEIARALLHRPRLLVLDEPTVGLDIKARAEIIGHVRRLVTHDRVSVLWATHLIDEVLDEDQVIILHRGRVLALGRADQIVEQEATTNLSAAFTKLTTIAAAGEEAA